MMINHARAPKGWPPTFVLLSACITMMPRELAKV